MPAASIVVVTHNGLAYLGPCLDSVVRAMGRDHELIVVDNASTDGGPDWVASHYPSITLVRNEANVGYAAACNQGARIASGDVLVFLNQDTRVEPGWLRALVDGLASAPDVGLATSRTLLMSRPDRIQLCGQDVHYTGLVFGRGYGCSAGEMDGAADVAAVSGASFAVRRDLWRALGGLDEAFHMYYEETDLSWRARLLGFRSRYLPRSILYHDYLPGQRNTLRFYHSARNRPQMLLKNWLGPTLCLLLPALLLAELVEWALALGMGWPGLRAKARAAGWLLAHLGDVRQRRRAVQAARLVPDAAILAERGRRLAPVETAPGPLARAVIGLCNALFWLNHRLAQMVCQKLGW